VQAIDNKLFMKCLTQPSFPFLIVQIGTPGGCHSPNFSTSSIAHSRQFDGPSFRQSAAAASKQRFA
jgi:hypothetical protein